MNWTKITDNSEVKALLKERKDIENKIKAIDENALIMYELEVLNIPVDSCWVRCSDCKYLKHEVRLGNPGGDIVECVQDSNESTFTSSSNIYEDRHCNGFELCS